MLTGIVQDLGSIKLIKGGLYKVNTNLDLSECKEGSSISCNGVCLTAKNIKTNQNQNSTFEVNIGEETLMRTNLGNNILTNKLINIEKSLKIGDEIGGHFVYGHVDVITSLKKIEKLNNSWEYNFEKNFDLNNRFIKEKASISINGISLTIANVGDSSFTISVIEHTFKNTNLQFLNIDDHVNVEFDYLARFVLNE
jgi:riboflavin synthase